MGGHLREAAGGEVEAEFYRLMGFLPASRTIVGSGQLATRPWGEIYDTMALLVRAVPGLSVRSCGGDLRVVPRWGFRQLSHTSGKHTQLLHATEQVMHWVRGMDMAHHQVPLFDVGSLFACLRNAGMQVCV